MLIQIAGKCKNRLQGLSCQLFVTLRIDVLNVQHDQICNRSQLFKQLHPVFIFRLKGNAGGIQTGMDSPSFCLGKQLCYKFNLNQRITAGCCDTALPVKGTIFFVLFHNLRHCHFCAAACFPGVRIVTVLTPHGTALEKDNETDTWSVYSAEAFNGMDMSNHRIRLLINWNQTAFIKYCRGRYGK